MAYEALSFPQPGHYDPPRFIPKKRPNPELSRVTDATGTVRAYACPKHLALILALIADVYGDSTAWSQRQLNPVSGTEIDHREESCAIDHEHSV